MRQERVSEGPVMEGPARQGSARERLVTLVGALGALALSLTMFLRGESGISVSRDVPRPTTEEHGPNGYLAAFDWLQSGGIGAVSLRGRFDKYFDGASGEGTAQVGARGADALEAGALSPQGNLLIVTLPVVTTFRSEEFPALDRWLRAGNTLLALAAVTDQPEWSNGFADLASGDLSYLTGLQLKAAGGSGAGDASAGRQGLASHRVSMVPNRQHAYFSGVRAVTVPLESPSRSWAMRVPSEGFVLSLAHDAETGEDVLWTRSIGRGRIIVSGLGSLFTNGSLGEADNAKLFSNIVSANVGPGGAVLFDDLHQGLTAGYDPGKFYKDRRLYLTLAILVALWLSWVLGSTALAVPKLRSPAPNETELVRATGGFFARVLHSPEGALRMLDLFFRRWGSRGSWEALERHPRVAASDVRQLHEWHAAAVGARRVPLDRLHNLLLKIEGQLSA